jgi:hypothetical protein
LAVLIRPDAPKVQRPPQTAPTIRRRGAFKAAAYLTVALAGVLGVATQVFHLGQTQAANLAFHYQRGYYTDNGWLCYGWGNGAYHCTQHWHREGVQPVSDNADWVPNVSASDFVASVGSHPIGTPATPASTAQVDTGNAAVPTQTPKPKPATPSVPSKPATTTPKKPASTSGANTTGQPCHSSNMFAPNIGPWTVPPDCYANVYTPNPKNYVSRPGFGWCNWWPEVLHPNQPDILTGKEYKRGSVPVPGAAIFFSGNVQGASSDGHFAQVVAVAPDHYWVLITEMNFAWRGAGFGKVNYRYIHVGPGVTFIYS